MIKVNPFFLADSYKIGHVWMYPKGTSIVYANFTPRSNKYAPKGITKVVSFGQQMTMKYIHDIFEENFFKTETRQELNLIAIEGVSEGIREFAVNRLANLRKEVLNEIKEEYDTFLGVDFDMTHIAALWDLGYLPIKVKALPEGTSVPMGVPVLTIYNTRPEFYWLTNFLETIISTLLWKPMTSASIADNFYTNIILKYANLSDKDNPGLRFLGHDFSMRGLDSEYAAMSSGLGHALTFDGSDSLPVLPAARYYYNAKGPIIHSVNATEHSVMCAGTKEDELETFRFLMSQFPTGILSVVSDTWDLWKVLTVILPQLKEEILKRDGKIVIRPDSGDPVDIICGTEFEAYETLEAAKQYFEDDLYGSQIHGEAEYEISVTKNVKVGDKYYTLCADTDWDRYDKQYYTIENITILDKLIETTPATKGVVELLWEIFGGTINDQGYKVLDPSIGAIYGDSINDERAIAISERLMAKGFASTNVVLGIGSFTYQFNTRDTFGFAMKATYCEITTKKLSGLSVEERPIFKDPITDDGTKKSAKGLLQVYRIKGAHGYSEYQLKDMCTWEEERKGELQVIYQDGESNLPSTLEEIRNRLRTNQC